MNRRGVTLMELLVAITLLSLLSVGILFGMRIGLSAMERANGRLQANRRVLGVERVITQQIAGFIPVKADCPARMPFFQGEPQTMRFVSTYSLNEAGRGIPRILEYQVIPGENGGVRLVVNELIYSGPLSTGQLCAGIVQNRMIFKPVQIGSGSFVLADKLASCRFIYKEEQELPKPDLWTDRWIKVRAPNAIRIEMSPLDHDPGKLEVPSITVPVRVNRDPTIAYSDIEP